MPRAREEKREIRSRQRGYTEDFRSPCKDMRIFAWLKQKPLEEKTEESSSSLAAVSVWEPSRRPRWLGLSRGSKDNMELEDPMRSMGNEDNRPKTNSGLLLTGWRLRFSLSSGSLAEWV